MFNKIWTALLYQPIYNIFMLVLIAMPYHDVGLAIIALTLLVKVALFPLTQKMIDGQFRMNAMQDELDQIKKTTTDKIEQGKLTQELYKKHNINPFSSCLLFIIQIVVLIALYQVFRGIIGIGTLPHLYSFVHQPAVMGMKLFGVLDISAKKNIIIVILAAGTQLVQAKLMQARTRKPTGDGMAAEFSKTMQSQMTYMLPLMIGFFAYIFPAAVALYWITSNIFTIGQELYTRKKMRAVHP